VSPKAAPKTEAPRCSNSPGLGSAPMSRSAARSSRLRERITLWLLIEIERVALSVLPRGRLRKRVLARVDRALTRMHLERPSKNDTYGVT
jgi:hypothetical protein